MKACSITQSDVDRRMLETVSSVAHDGCRGVVVSGQLPAMHTAHIMEMTNLPMSSSDAQTKLGTI
jgi:hypothetical protein